MMNRKFTVLLVGLSFTVALAATGCGNRTAGTEKADENADSVKIISTETGTVKTTGAAQTLTAEAAETALTEAGNPKGKDEKSDRKSSETSAAEGRNTGTSTDAAAADISDTGNASELGKLADFNAILLDGSSFTQKDVADKDVTVVNFWSVMCGPCVDEMPELAELSMKLPDNVQVVTVCLDGDYDRETAKDILKDAGYDGKTIISWDGDLNDVIDNIQYTPTTIVAGGDGKLLGDAIIGSPDDLEKVYLEAINYALKIQGKESVSLEK